MEPPTAAKQALQDLPLLDAAARALGGAQRRPPARHRAPRFRLARRSNIYQLALLALRGWSPGAPQRRGPPALVRLRARVRQVPSTPAADPAGFLQLCIMQPGSLLVACGPGKYRQLRFFLRWARGAPR